MTESEQPEPRAVPEFDVADRMRKALRESGTGISEIAEYLGVSRTSVSNWISGRIEPSVQTMRLWALRCGVDYGWLTGGRVPATAAPGLNKLGKTVPFAQVRALGVAA